MSFKETKDEVIIEMKSTKPTVEKLLFLINQALKDDNWILKNLIHQRDSSFRNCLCDN
ncbi:hypothetical protein [Lysinibacillus sp. JNUCC-52]|uniref:hypothetical protein n=1 Tax=Lysinibacillus sp. JNUCC-52 TaxID=2792480 RepID=UPI001937D35C|nr:hypothetical protein JNUCC52_02235 [Lysinibacillus sp. JNUCC-52]